MKQQGGQRERASTARGETACRDAGPTEPAILHWSQHEDVVEKGVTRGDSAKETHQLYATGEPPAAPVAQMEYSSVQSVLSQVVLLQGRSSVPPE